MDKTVDTGETRHRTLREFAPDEPCPKCGSDDLWTHYRKDSHEYACRDHRVPQPYDATDTFACSTCGDEHFDRGCRRCSFVWREEVAADG